MSYPAEKNVQTRRIQDLGSGKLSTSVVLAIAEAAGLRPLEMEPLHATIDPELIDLLDRAGPAISTDIMFDFHGFRVTVTGDRQITFYPLNDDGTDPTARSPSSEGD